MTISNPVYNEVVKIHTKGRSKGRDLFRTGGLLRVSRGVRALRRNLETLVLRGGASTREAEAFKIAG